MAIDVITPSIPDPNGPDPIGPDPHSRRQRLLVDLNHVRGLVVEAELTKANSHRYVAAHQAAVHAAEVVLLARTGRGLRPGVIDPWLMVRRCAPELGEWADFFAATSVRRRMAAEHRGGISTREADDLVRDADRFCTEVERMLRRDAGRRSGSGHSWGGGSA